MIIDIQKKQQELEQKYINLVAETDKKALELNKKNKAEAIAYLTKFSVKQGDNTFAEWKKLYGFLFTKYMDGNIKTPSSEPMPKVESPGYSEDFYKTVIEKTGDKFKVIGNPTH